MKVIMLCLEFPPVNTTGNYRSAGFARYLSKNGIDTIVITGTIDTLEATFNKKSDYNLLNDLETVKIYRFPIASIKGYWFKGLGNKLRIWWNSTDRIDKRWYVDENKKQIDAIIKKEKPDLLYVSLPPFSVARTALEISRKFHIPLITDMRDAWSLWVSNPFSTRFHYRKIYNLERRLFNQSSLIIGVTPELVEDFKAQHPAISSGKFTTIFNGYDHMDFKKGKNQVNSDVYIIGYVGSFYYDPNAESLMDTEWYKRKGLKKFYYVPRKEQWKYRSPYFFLKALSHVLKTNPKLVGKIRFEYVGNAPVWFIKMINNFNLNEVFVNHGFKTKKEVLEIQSSWNAILATSEKVMNGLHFCLPSKLFDVIKTKKQILAFVTPGSQYNFLQNYKQVKFFNPDDINTNVEILKAVITENKNVSFDNLSEDFTRENQSRELLKLLKPFLNG